MKLLAAFLLGVVIAFPVGMSAATREDDEVEQVARQAAIYMALARNEAKELIDGKE